MFTAVVAINTVGKPEDTFCIRSTAATFLGDVAPFYIGSVSLSYILRHGLGNSM